jgi:hypothetical protein
MTSSKSRAEELLSIYSAKEIKSFVSNGNVFFGFELQNAIFIPIQLSGAFRCILKVLAITVSVIFMYQSLWLLITPSGT